MLTRRRASARRVKAASSLRTRMPADSDRLMLLTCRLPAPVAAVSIISVVIPPPSASRTLIAIQREQYSRPIPAVFKLSSNPGRASDSGPEGGPGSCISSSANRHSARGSVRRKLMRTSETSAGSNLLYPPEPSAPKRPGPAREFRDDNVIFQYHPIRAGACAAFNPHLGRVH